MLNFLAVVKVRPKDLNRVASPRLGLGHVREVATEIQRKRNRSLVLDLLCHSLGECK